MRSTSAWLTSRFNRLTSAKIHMHHNNRAAVALSCKRIPRSTRRSRFPHVPFHPRYHFHFCNAIIYYRFYTTSAFLWMPNVRVGWGLQKLDGSSHLRVPCVNSTSTRFLHCFAPECLDLIGLRPISDERHLGLRSLGWHGSPHRPESAILVGAMVSLCLWGKSVRFVICANG